MLKRFVEIENLARFEHSEGCAAHEFSRWNVIFADNGRGKSTITSIFRSLSENQPSHLLSRKTLGQPNQPKVKLMFDDPSGKPQLATFDGSSWDTCPCKALVFDQDFVDANVHLGGKVEYSQKRGLYEVFIGKQTGDLVEKINNKDEEIRQLNPKIALASNSIQQHIKSDISLNDFMNLPVEKDLEESIKSLETRLSTIQNKTTVLKAAAQQKISYGSPDLSKLEEMLGSSIKTLSDEAKEAVQSQIKHIGTFAAEGWIEQGHQFSKHTHGDCPFCGQDLDANKLITQYNEYFNREYTQEIQKLHSYRQEVLSSLSISSLVTFGRLTIENEARMDYWIKNGTAGLVRAEFEVDAMQSTLTELGGQLEELFTKKTQDPLTPLSLPQEVNESIDRLTAHVGELERYNQIVEANNEIIARFKARLMETDDTFTVTKDLNLLKDHRSRHSKAVNTLCLEFNERSAEKKKLEKEKAGLRTRLDAASEKLIEKHQEEINRCLAKSGASFSIQRIENGHGGGRPNSTFVLEINGEEVSADSSLENEPSLRSALSAGDKTSLAFAFFVSHALADSNLSDSILVIDDPISSLDSGRRNNTLLTIYDLFTKSNQGILLSHDPDFLHGIWQKMGSSPNDRVSYRLIRNGARATKISKWDVEKQAESEQKARVQLMQDFVTNGLRSDQNLRDVISVIRPVLEHAYKASYPKEFPSADSLGMFIGHIKGSNAPYLVNVKSRLDDLEAVNDYVTPFSSHDSGGTVPEPNDTEVSTHTNIALSLLRV